MEVSCLTAGERAPGTHWTGGWVGPRAFWMQWWRGKNSYPCWESEPSCPSHSL